MTETGTKPDNSAVLLAEGSRRSVRPSTRRKRLQILVSVALLIVILVVWDLVTRTGFVSHLVLPAPADTFRALYLGLGEDGRYWSATASTMGSAVSGFLIAATAALIIAAIVTTFPFLEGVISPYIVALQSLPKIAVSPLIILWLGFGSAGKITIVALVAFFPILVNAIQGLRIRDRDQYELMLSIGASKMQMFRLLRLPGGVPYFFAGFQVGIVFSLLGAIVAEFVGSRNGLGYLLLAERNVFNVPGVFAILIILMVLGTTLYLIMHWLERKAAFWAVDVSSKQDVATA